MNNPLEVETVIVGGGSSGCVIAGRLAEAGRDVLLLEAGPDYGARRSKQWPTELIDARMLATSHDWGYQAGRWTFQRARVIGGCSSHNGAIAAIGALARDETLTRRESLCAAALLVLSGAALL